MSGPIQFSPAHPQPFTLEQAVQLDINILVAGKLELALPKFS